MPDADRSQIIFFADRGPESLAQRGFCKSGIRKTWFSKNLDRRLFT
jgi:hypothetical protein